MALASRFLGPAHAAGGPFALLGLAPSDCDEHRIMAALDHQLARLNTDPQGESPESDELRLALHAAAAQLLDPTTRQHLINRWSTSADSHRTHPPARDRAQHTQTRAHQHTPRPAPPQSKPSPPSAQQTPQPSHARRPTPSNELEARALQYVAQHGGWTPAALRQISLLVQSKGLPPTEVTRLVRSLATQPTPPAPSEPASHAPAPNTDSEQNPVPIPRPGVPGRALASAVPLQSPSASIDDDRDTSSDGSLLRALLYAVALIFLLLTGAVVIALFLADHTPSLFAQQDEQTTTTPEASDGPAGAPSEDPAEDPDTPRQEPRADTAAADPRQEISVNALRASFAATTENPDAAIEALDRLAANWTQLTHEQRTAAHDGLIEALHDLIHNDPGMDLILDRIIDHAAPLFDDEHALQPGDEFYSAIWAAGIINRLRAERDFPASATTTIRQTWRRLNVSRTASSTFIQGVRAALDQTHRRIASGEPHTVASLLNDWIKITSRSDLPRHQADGLILNALDSIIHHGPNLARHRGVGDAFSELIRALDWSEDGQARNWLVSLYDQKDVTTAHINHIVNRIIDDELTDAIGREAIVPADADQQPLARIDARNALEKDWGLDGPEARAQAGQAWSSAFAQTTERLDADRTPVDAIATAVLFARLNQAAAHKFEDDTTAAANIIDNLDDPLAQASAAVADAAAYPEADGPDGQWATEYLAVSNRLSPRLDLLARFPASGNIGQIDGAVLAREALLGNHPQIRSAATTVASRHARQPAIIHGILDVLPDVPKTQHATEFLEHVTGHSLPSTASPNWRHEARRGVVQRFLELLAAQSEEAAIESFSRAITAAHLATAGESTDADDATPVEAAAKLHAHWRTIADGAVPSSNPPITIDQIERNHAARIGVASGPVQRFAVEQLAACELMAYTVAAERRHRTEDIRDLLDDLAAQRREARHILQQIRDVEHTMARLWSIRMGGSDE